jgi:hypothetical protein
MRKPARREPKCGCQLVVHGEQGARAVEHENSSVFKGSERFKTGFRAVERREDVDAAESDIACSEPALGHARGEEERIQAERAGRLEQPSIGRAHPVCDDR